MYNLLLTILLVLSVLLIISIFMQPQKNPSSNVFDSSGSEALFERSKARGFEAFMQRFYRCFSLFLATNRLSIIYFIKSLMIAKYR
ncbi:Preprotein translocase subunit SecG [Streptococcus agalactiae]|nr:Preprotein translocase subunit SecG [Streptococcus agalactiae]